MRVFLPPKKRAIKRSSTQLKEKLSRKAFVVVVVVAVIVVVVIVVVVITEGFSPSLMNSSI